jgi:hypothetical protein
MPHMLSFAQMYAVVRSTDPVAQSIYLPFFLSQEGFLSSPRPGMGCTPCSAPLRFLVLDMVRFLVPSQRRSARWGTAETLGSWSPPLFGVVARQRAWRQSLLTPTRHITGGSVHLLCCRPEPQGEGRHESLKTDRRMPVVRPVSLSARVLGTGRAAGHESLAQQRDGP